MSKYLPIPAYNIRHWRWHASGRITGVVENHPVHGTKAIRISKVLGVEWVDGTPTVITWGGSRYRLHDPIYGLHFEKLCKLYPPPEAPDA